jgi:ferric-dicitrate binding protein FerR (iron transport regulator)
VKEKILAQISSECQVKSSRSWFRFFRAAAVAAGLVAAVLLGWHIADLRKPETFEMVAERGQKSSLTLPDGSKVWLNSASKLTYTSDYNSKDRNIILDGEAFFDVARNENLPFIVHANGMAVQALGTKFNVKAYSDETEVTAILVEGSVKASAAGVDLLLLPYFVASYDRSTDEMVSTYVSD